MLSMYFMVLIVEKVLAPPLPLGEGWGEGINAKTFATIDNGFGWCR